MCWSPLPASIIKLEGIQSLLVVICGGVDFVNLQGFCSSWRCGVSWVSAIGFLTFGLFLKSLPFVFSCELSSLGSVLVLCILVRAVIEELWVDFHE